MAEAPVSAAQAIGEYLQSPDDLVKVSAFRRKLEKEKASIDVRLKTGVKEQLEATRRGLASLLGTRANLQVIRDEMSSIDNECQDMSIQVSTFDQISRVSMVHRSFESTEEIVSNLREMASKLDEIEDMLAEDSMQLDGPAPNLLMVHYHLKQFQRFRDETTMDARKASKKAQEALARRFERLDWVITQFDEYFGNLARNILPLIRAGHSDVIVRLLKIAEVEEKEDEKALAMRFAKKATAFKFMAAHNDARVLKHYRQKIMKAIAHSIQSKLDSLQKENEQDPTAFLQKLNWLYKDIRLVEKGVIPCFPADYDIYSHYVREYHKAVNSVVKRITETKLEGTAMLGLYKWTKYYQSKMNKLGVPPELMEPPLLDGKEQELIERYLELIVQRLEEWTANLMIQDIAPFITRQEPPEIDDEDGLYGTQGAITLFQMVNQQIDLAAETGQVAILARVVGEVCRVMRGVQDQWTKTIESEFKRFIEKPGEVPGGLVEWCIALANEQFKSANYSEGLLARLETQDLETYREAIHVFLNDSIDGYLDVAKKCIQTLINIIFNDLKPATKSLFQQPWYDGVMQQIVETLRDYMADCQGYLNSALLDLMIDDLLDGLMLAYLNALAMTSKLRMPAAADRMREDIKEVSLFFSSLIPDQNMQARLGILEHVQGMLSASPDLFLLSYWPFAKEYGPNLTFVETLLEARDDLRGTVKDILESIRERVEEERITDPSEPTIMNKVILRGIIAQAATAASRLLRS
ncbi:exocyst complex component Sec6-domain-containing protein [Coprinopsis sp. MPI-PUGE-AT-0042]|nr:exocyst complex component Sec6-domain-containing protein [Coprinopsis sp. MPI-PUGE-AT-0042]